MSGSDPAKPLSGDDTAPGTRGADSMPALGGGLPALSRGAQLGRYTVLERVGRGGMGVVYAAYDEELDRKVALKLMLPSRSSATRRERMLREARALARLNHPSVVAVHEVGEHDRGVFIAMEFVEGQTLREWWNARDRDWRQVVDHFARAGEGLAAAHEAGLVHRDFKPDNVMIDQAGRVRVLDFGVARWIGTATEDQPESSDLFAPPTGLTRVGAFVGTFPYVPPEVHAGAKGDAKADQFAFCVSLYETLAGQRPFTGEELAAASAPGGTLPPPPRLRGVPNWLNASIVRGLSFDRAERFASMAELVARLGPRRGRGRAVATVIAVTAGAAALGSLATMWSISTPDACASWLTTSRKPKCCPTTSSTTACRSFSMKTISHRRVPSSRRSVAVVACRCSSSPSRPRSRHAASSYSRRIATTSSPDRSSSRASCAARREPSESISSR